MNKVFVLCSAMIIGFLSCTAKDAKKTNGETKEKSLLWSISGNGLEKTSYILGTIHLICPDDYFWTEKMQEAFEASEKVAFELDMDDPALSAQVQSGLVLKDGKKLKDFFTDEEYKKLSDFSQENLGMPLDLLQSYKPFALMSLISMKSVSCMIPESYEGNIMKITLEAEKEILGLETADDQLAIFDAMDSDTVASQLMSVIENFDSLKSQYNQMLITYKEQDLEGLHQLVIESPDFKFDLNTLLYNRNRKWIGQIKELSNEHAMFYAVGAGHLSGDEGVLNLLREQGFTVEPVK